MTQNATRFTTWLATKGITNWVVAARVTDRLRRQYGADVQVLTQKRYRELERQCEVETAGDHPAVDDLRMAAMEACVGNCYSGRTRAGLIIAALRKAGWRIEPVYSERGHVGGGSAQTRS